MDQAVKNAVGNRRIADLLVPVSDGHLRSKNDGSPLIAVIADFEKVAALAIFEGSHGEVIEHQNVDSRQFQQHSSDAAVHMGYGKFTEQFGGSFVQDRKAVAAGFLRQSAGQPTLPDSRRTGHIMPMVSK